MGEATINPLDIRTWWGCLPVPEQHLLVTLSGLVNTPTPWVSFTDAETILAFWGGNPAEERLLALAKYGGITILDEGVLFCIDERGCIDLAGSPYIVQVYGCRLLQGCEIGAPVQEPCFYWRTAPEQ